MPRIRTIKPEFFGSPSHPDDPWARYVFIALWTWADDYGVGTFNERELLGYIFPNDDWIDSCNLHEWLMSVESAYDLTFYKVGKRAYYHIPSWDEHQVVNRPSKKRNPTPDDATEFFTLARNTGEEEGAHTNAGVTHESLMSDSREVPRGKGKGKGTGKGSGISSSEIAKAIPDQERPEVESLCTLLADLVEENGSRRPKTNKQARDAARLLIDKDGYTPEQVAWIIRWSQNDEFWKTNILSMSKLRAKFDQLKLKATTNRRGGKPTTDDRVQGGLEIARMFEEMENGNADSFSGSQGAIEGSWV